MLYQPAKLDEALLVLSPLINMEILHVPYAPDDWRFERTVPLNHLSNDAKPLIL